MSPILRDGDAPARILSLLRRHSLTDCHYHWY